MGHLKSQAALLGSLLSDMLVNNPIAELTSPQDLQTVERRVESEGMVFLTSTLPGLGKAFDVGINTGHFLLPAGWRAREALPLFMGGYFRAVFSESDGRLLESPRIEAIAAIRQVCFFCYKLEVPYDPAVTRSFVDKFVQVDQSLPSTVEDLIAGSEEVSRLLWVSAHVADELLRKFVPSETRPRHGPGAVAPGLSGDAKWEYLAHFVNARLETEYPFDKYFVVGGLAEIVEREISHRLVPENPTAWSFSRLVPVPKDSRGPRLISLESLETQWIQQGQSRELVSFIESKSKARGKINFADQTVNQLLALSSSRSGEYATLDLSDASDRVSLALVRSVFLLRPDLLRLWEASRSTHTLLPSKEYVELKKFAPMGSAMCFPVEAIVFWCLCVAAIQRYGADNEISRHDLDPTDVYVYGDDIIVPVEVVDVVIAALESVHLKVNAAKSCYLSSFRESCGVDAFDGHIITPLRARKLFPTNVSDGLAFASWASLGNRLHSSGYLLASARVFEMLEQVFGPVPFGLPTSGFVCRWAPDYITAVWLNVTRGTKSRWNSELQHTEFLVYFLKPGSVASLLDGWPRLMRNLVEGGHDEFDPSTVDLPYSTKIKRGWRRV